MKIGPAELLVIIIFAFVIIGPERLPKAGKAIGQALGKLRKTGGSIDETLKEEGLDPKSLKEASNNPFLALEKIEKIANAIPQDEDVEESDGGEQDAAQAEEEKASSVTPLSDLEAFEERKAQIAEEASAEVADEASELTDDNV